VSDEHSPVTIQARVAEARETLRHAGLEPDEAGLDARLLAEMVLGWDAARFYTSAPEPAPPGFSATYAALVARRTAREPLAYITGRREFWGLSFEVTPAVLIPRPETELIVESALQFLADLASGATLVDVCTGSGCVAIALARERPRARILATDISPGALEVARRNAVRLGVADGVQFMRADLLAIPAGQFDLIVSNPPYVPERFRLALPPEVRDHEPAVALFGGGDDGLATIRRLVAQSVTKLAPDGILITECGVGQGEAVSQVIGATGGLTMIGLRRDLQGIPRTAIARRTAG
jgi:release factor glutamine methyltransferase